MTTITSTVVRQAEIRFREADIADHPRQRRDELGRFDAPDGIDRLARVGGRHGHQSQHTPHLVI